MDRDAREIASKRVQRSVVVNGVMLLQVHGNMLLCVEESQRKDLLLRCAPHPEEVIGQTSLIGANSPQFANLDGNLDILLKLQWFSRGRRILRDRNMIGLDAPH